MKRFAATLLITALLAGPSLAAGKQTDAAKSHGTDHSGQATGPAKSSAAKLKPQTTCPVMGGSINKELFLDHEGKRIYVCCAGCIAQLKKDPAKYIAKLRKMGQDVEVIETATPDTTSLVPQKTCPVMGGAINKELYFDHDGKRIYVCCAGCIKQVESDPAKYVAKLALLGEAPESVTDAE